MNVIVRDATLGDVYRVAEIHIASWRDTYHGIVPQAFLDSMDLDERTQRWTRSFDRTTCKLIVAEIDAVIVGWCYFGVCRDTDVVVHTAELWAIYIDPLAKNQGIGSALWTAAKESLLDQGYLHSIVWVLKENERAIRFYSKMGFVSDGFQKSISIDDAALQELRMTTVLKA
jgi:L-amino acid N-acyltransferase YncA